MDQWIARFDREPLSLTVVNVIETIPQLLVVSSVITQEKFRGKLILGFDSEHMSNPCVWKDFEDAETFYKPYDPHHCGPYVRTIQLACPSGRVVVLDINKLARDNEAFVFKEIETILKYVKVLAGFAVKSDEVALERSFGIKLENTKDTQVCGYSLRALVKKQFDLEMPQEPHYTIWKQEELTVEVIDYAAMDALASLDLYIHKSVLRAR